jgi:hypothetical protein
MFVPTSDGPTDLGWWRDRHRAEVGALLAGIAQRPGQMLALATTALAWAGCVSLTDSDDGDLDEALSIARDAYFGHFHRVLPESARSGDARAAASSATLALTIGGQSVRVRWARPGPETTLATWHTAWCVAQILDDDRLRSTLRSTPSAVFGSLSHPDRAWLQAMKAISDALGTEVARRASRLDARPTSNDAPARQSLIAALRHILDRDARSTNVAIAQLLQRHRGAATHDTAPPSLALDALAVASTAAKAGLRVDVRSEALPLRLWRRERVDREWWLCTVCGTTAGDTHRGPAPSRCETCQHDLSLEPPRRISATEWPMLTRVPCEPCGELVLAWARQCPKCATERPDARLPTRGRPVAPGRQPRPARWQLIGVNLHRREIIARLARAGFRVDRVADAPLRRASDALWELQIDVADPASAASEAPTRRSYHAWEARDGVYVETYLGLDTLSDWWRLALFVAALHPEGAVFDHDARAPITADQVATWASGLAPPPASSLFGVHLRFDPAHRRAWLYTRGLARCLGFDLEMLDIPAVHADHFRTMVTATAFRLLEHGETDGGLHRVRGALPTEGEPFLVGEGVRVCWRPSTWARSDAPSSFGAPEAHRVGVSGAFATICPLDAADQPATASDLAVPLILGVPLWESRWELNRRARQATARLDRFDAWRRRRPQWRFRVRCQVPGPTGNPSVPAAWRLLDASDPPPTDLLDWRIEHTAGVFDPFDAESPPAEVATWDDVTPVHR